MLVVGTLCQGEKKKCPKGVCGLLLLVNWNRKVKSYRGNYVLRYLTIERKHPELLCRKVDKVFLVTFYSLTTLVLNCVYIHIQSLHPFDPVFQRIEL